MITERDVPRRRPARWPLVAAIVVFAIAVALWSRPERVGRWLSAVLPTPTSASTPTPPGEAVAATARAMVESGDLGHAIGAWSTAAADTTGVEAHASLARLLALRRRYTDALAAGRAAVAAGAADPDAHAALAFALDWSGDHRAGIQEALVAIEIDSTHVPALAVLAEAYATSGHKWMLAPKGTGLLYLSEELGATIDPVALQSGRTAYSASSGVSSRL